VTPQSRAATKPSANPPADYRALITSKKGHWGRVGTLAYTTPHDRSNDVLRA
jgi:hypothetical protein